MQIATRQGHNGYGKVPTQCPAELSSSLIFRFVDRIGQVKYVCQLNAKYESATQAFCGPLQRDTELFGERGKSSTYCSKLISHTFFIGTVRVLFSFFFFCYTRPAFYLTAR